MEPEPPPPPPRGTPDDPTLPLGAPPQYPPTVIDETVEGPPPPPPPPGEPPPERTIWPWLLGLLVVVLGGLLLLWLLTRDHKSSTASVPAVVGLPQQAAAARLRAAGFNSQIRLTPSRRPRGVVLAQAPQAGAKLSKGSAVALTVSGGPPKTGVPDVVGLPAARAMRILTDAGLKVRQTSVASDKPAGTVVSQRPTAGEQAVRGTPILLEVSKGPQTVAVPDLVGEKVDEAGAKLRKAGFVPAVVSVPSDKPAGIVVAQKPAGGEKAPKGTRVRLNVSQGAGTTTATTTTTTTTATTTSPQPATVAVPDVVGQKQVDAQKSLRAAGLRPRTVYVASTQPAGTVVAQHPAAGTTVKRGSDVRINVSNGPQPKAAKTIPDVTGEDEQTATADLQAAGFQVQVFDQPTTDQSQDGIVIFEDPPGGTKAPAGSQVAIYVGRFSG